VVYVHPWEFDPGQPRGRGLGLVRAFRRRVGVGRKRAESSRRCSTSSASRPPVQCSSNSGSSWRRPRGFPERAMRRALSREFESPVVASKPQLRGKSTFAAALPQGFVPTSRCVRGRFSRALVAPSMRDAAAGSGGQANELTIPAWSGYALEAGSGLDAGWWRRPPPPLAVVSCVAALAPRAETTPQLKLACPRGPLRGLTVTEADGKS
jgi:hypothetical protein